MRVSNVVYHYDLAFEEYLKLPGINFSFLRKNAPKEVTQSMLRGIEVHKYLLEPHKMKEISPEVRQAAMKLKEVLGPLMKFAQFEVSITADFEYNGFVLNWKGRIDVLIPGRLVIDIKVSKLEIIQSIVHFRYDRPITGYMLGAGIDKAVLISVHPEDRNKKPAMESIKPDYDFWKQRVLDYGKPKNI